MLLPESFVLSLQSLLGEGADAVLKALADEPVSSVRANPFRAVTLPAADPVPWASDACYLPERGTYTFDPLFHAGCYYVQEASSMFLEQVVRRYVTGPVTALDLCAAPGGKTTLLRSVLPEGSLLVSNEIMPARAQVLVENVIKWGHPGCVVTGNAPADFAPLAGLFDVVVADVPCSGEGMFRKDPVAVTEWSEANVATCWSRARDIIADVWPALRPGGLLVFSTCTFNVHEDEENVRWIADNLGAEVLPVPAPEEWGITGNLLAGETFPVAHFFPGRTRGEGFFLAALRKGGEMAADEAAGTASLLAAGTGASQRLKDSRKGAAKNAPAGVVPSAVRQWLSSPDDFVWSAEADGRIVAIPQRHAAIVAQLRRRLRVLHAGVLVGEQKGHDILPTQCLALSTALASEAFPRAEIGWLDALRYLRREAVTLASDTPRGFVLLTFRGIPLGFVKNLGNRANNLYPAEWRIRTTHLPAEEVTPVVTPLKTPR